jgi:hypothetical protein
MRDFAVALWRPMAAGAVMAAAVLMLNAGLPFRGPPRLFLDIALGASTYGGALMLLWALNGRPAGPESAAWELARTRFAPLRGRPA